MSKYAKIHTDKLEDIKKNIEQAHSYFSGNYKRYQEFMKFVFVDTLNDNDKAKLRKLGKPPLTANSLEAYISRLRGEFMKNQPGVTVRAAEGLTPVQMNPNFLQMISVVEAHLREILFNTNNDQMGYQVYTDILAGGFSWVEVYTDYINNKSFKQNIYAERVFNPVLCYADPLARASHKGDGRYIGQIVPRSKGDFEDEFGKDALKGIKFSRNLEGFNWSYKNDKEDIVLVSDYYFKKVKSKKIYELSNGSVIKKEEYEKMLDIWAQEQILMQPPAVVRERYADFETICRYRICETEVLDYVETNYDHFPLVFFDGNSVNLQKDSSGSFEQVTRPYVYHAKDVQRLKDFTIQTMANEIENMIESKLMAPIEGIPEEYLDNYKLLQESTVIPYKSFLDEQPEIRLEKPSPIPRVPTPPIVMDTLMTTDRLTQTILGSYDAALGIQSNNISGKAISEGSQQSGEAADPWSMGYIRGLNRVAEIITSLVPKYYITPRTIPVLLPDGKRDYKVINAPQPPQQPAAQGQPQQEQDPMIKAEVYMHYDPKDLMVKVEATSSFRTQRETAARTMIDLMKVLPSFAQYMDEMGAPLLLDNFEFRGSDILKATYPQFIEQLKQKKEQAQQQQQQQQQIIQGMAQQEQQLKVKKDQREDRKLQGEEMFQAANLSLKDKEHEEDYQIDAAGVAIQNKNADTNFLNVMSKIRMDSVEAGLKEEQFDAENARTAVDAAIDISKHQLDLHKHEMDMMSDFGKGEE